MNPSKVATIGISLFVFSASSLFGALVPGASTSSMKTFEEGTEKLVVYTDIPGHSAIVHGINPRIKSDVYEIRVRSAASKNEWVSCFANYTYNRALELPSHKANAGDKDPPTLNQAYLKHSGGWSQTYANIEMSEHSTVEVEISKIGDTLLDRVAVIEKSAIHPSHKIFDKRDENGKVYFKLNKPCQVVIDINGQMDDHNTAYPEFAQKGPVHAVSFFANPILQKPPSSGEGICFVNAGSKPDATPNFTTMVFAPGVHHIGAGFKIYAKKSYYIPGDAILYGSFTNKDTPVGGLSSGDGISIYGYGTVCGFFTPHHSYNDKNPNYPNYKGGSPVGLIIEDTVNLTLKGITFVDPANFCTHIFPFKDLKNDKSKVSWVKGISWRVNGDGFSVPFALEDSFMRTSDDCTALFNDRRRCTFWKDSNANIIRLRNWAPGVTYTVEDCDVLYNRRRPGASGGVFVLHNAAHMQFKKPIPVNVTIKDIRFHDRKSDMPIFNLDSSSNNGGVSYVGLKFENISCYVPFNSKINNQILGTAETPWNEGLILKNVTFNHNDGKPPVKVTKDNLKSYFKTNEFVANVRFDDTKRK